MESSKFGYWLQIGANIGILTGLVLVGIQISQSNGIATANLASASFQETTDRLLAQMGENPSATMAKALMEPEKLTSEDILVMIAYAQWHITRMQRDELMESFGVYSDDGWRTQLRPTGELIGRIPVAREHLLNYYRDDSRWWVVELRAAAETQTKNSRKGLIEEYLAVARSYQDAKE